MPFTSDWKQCGGTCPKCDAPSVESRTWESSDEAHEDVKFRCVACSHNWWVDGDDG